MAYAYSLSNNYAKNFKVNFCFPLILLSITRQTLDVDREA